MSVVGLLEEKMTSQDEYDYEVMEKNIIVYFRLGNAVASINLRDVFEFDRPHKKTQHTEECHRSQSVICPKCGAFVKVEVHDIHYEDTYYDAFCKKCYWSSDDAGGRAPINEWLDKNDYSFSCDCPLVEEPPQAEYVATYLFQMLQYKNKENHSLSITKGES